MQPPRRQPQRYRGRLAPSPTGHLHLGIARTCLLAWLRARRAGGDLVMRMEDLDPPRVVAGAAEAICEDLRWLGLDWDEGPDIGGPHAPYTQSQRAHHYQAALDQLRDTGQLFACTCSRREVAAASSAPHGVLGPRYPGTCREGPTHPERTPSLRFRMAAQAPRFVDVLHGEIEGDGADDFVLRRADGLFAYQLAVVVDDAAMGITEVVRGDDLLSATPRQVALYGALGMPTPSFLHVPIVVGPDGRRLATRHAATPVRRFREQQVTPEQVIGVLAASAGLVPAGTSVSAAELVAGFGLDALPRTPAQLDADLLFNAPQASTPR